MDLLEQLIFNNRASKEFKELDGKLVFTLQTLTAGDNLEIDQKMLNVTGTTTYIMHTYSLHILSYALIKLNGVDFTKKTKEEIYNELKDKSGSIVDFLSKTHGDFEKECKNLITKDNIENFSETPSTKQDSNS